MVMIRPNSAFKFNDSSSRVQQLIMAEKRIHLSTDLTFSIGDSKTKHEGG